ncbi:MAG: tetratricopeptide repeat protein, partial [Acidaminococcaceae bacterium]|nr:tetratricopeptide repeat protein [Acidaminococcaceae bacterium]
MSGRYKEALPLQEQAFALQKEVLGEKHVIWDVTVNCCLSCYIANLTRLSRVRFYILPEGSLHIGKYIV